MELPQKIRSVLESEAESCPQGDLISAARNLSERYRGERFSGARLASGTLDALAYALARMPATYAAVSMAVRLSGFSEIRSLLDLGAGTGAASLAAAECFSLSQITCLERESAMRSLGQRLLRASELPGTANALWQPFDLETSPVKIRADLVTASYLLNELPQASRDSVLEEIWAAADRALLLVEPGTPEGYRILMVARRKLLALGAHIAAPCTHESPCPVERGDWCAFSCRVSRSKLQMRLKGGELPYEDEKFCFLAVTREESSQDGFRLLRHPQIAPGRISLTLCGDEGIIQKTVSKKDGTLFKEARKASAGDLLNL